MAEMGPFSYLVIFSMISVFLLSLVAIVTHVNPPKKPRKIWMGLGVLLILGVGVSFLLALAGYALGMLEVSEALARVVQGKEEEMRAHGQQLALIPVKIASGNVFALIVGVFTFVRALRYKSSQS